MPDNTLTIWFSEEVVAAWWAAPQTTPGGQPHYSDLPITTVLVHGGVAVVHGGRRAQTSALVR